MWLTVRHPIINCVAIFAVFVHSIDSSNFWPFPHSDPEINENITEIITRNGFVSEEYNVTTVDGFILCLIRILNAKHLKSRGVVFLQHGLLDSAHTWVNNLRNQSLGFILSDEGYDVWLGNSRGNIYSRSHLNLNNTDKKFWDFSYDEMAEYDLPACIEYISNITGSKKLAYIGHSQGTQIGFARFSTDPVLRSRISVFVALAPVAYVANVKSPIKYLAKLAERSKSVIDHFISGEFRLNLHWLNWIFCRLSHTEFICSNALFLFAGYDLRNLNKTRIPVYIAHTPAGTSFRNMIHHAQGYTSKRFQRFDYGSDLNMHIYGHPTPPEYNLDGFDVPVAIFTGGNDWLADPVDVETLKRQINHSIVFQMHQPHYNHLDFVWGVNAHLEIYPSVLTLLEHYTHI